MNLLRRKWLVGTLCLGTLLLLLAPTIVSRTGVVKKVLTRFSESSGVSIKADSVAVGWFTPLKLKNVTIGPDTSENHFRIFRVDTDLTIFDLVGAGSTKPRDWVLIRVRVATSFKDDRCDLVDDLNRLLKDNHSRGLIPRGKFRLEGTEVNFTDSDAENHWVFTDARAEVSWQPRSFDAKFFAAINARADPATEMVGEFSGTASVTQEEKSFRIDAELLAKDLAVANSSVPTASKTQDSKSPPAGTLEALTQKLNRGELVWSEPNLALSINALCDGDEGNVTIESATLTSDCCKSSLSGVASWNSGLAELKLRGNATLHMQELASRLEAFIGDKIELNGEHQTPVAIELSRTADGEIALAAQGQIGWDSGEIAAMKLGPASVPLRLDNADIHIASTRVPTGEGHVNLAGRIRYRPGSLCIQLPAGELAHAVQVTPEITERWLRFIAPPVADVRGVEGRFDLEIDQGTIVPGDPLQHRVKGRLRVHGADLTLSPMVEELMVVTKHHLSQTTDRSKQSVTATNTPKVTMPSQTIEFELSQGLVSHKNFVMEVDGVPIEISGDIALDSRIDMIARVPLDSPWLKPELQGKPGEVVELPLNGTVFHPLVDRSRIKNSGSKIADAIITLALDLSLRMQRGLNKSILDTAKSLKHLSSELLELSEQVAERSKESKN